MKWNLLFFQWLVVSLPLLAGDGVEGGGGGKQVVLTDYAAHRNGDDWAPAILKAFEDGRTVQVPEGRYFSSKVVFPPGTILRGSGDATVFVPLGERLFDVSGKEGEEFPVKADIEDFSDVIRLDGAGRFAPGDDIMIRGQRNAILREGKAGVNHTVDWVLGRTRRSSCFFGEMDVIGTVEDGKIVTRNKRLFPDYFKDDSREPEPPTKGFLRRKSTTVSKLAMVKNVVIRDLAVEGTEKCSMPFRLSFCKDCLVENITFTSSVESFEKDGDPELSLVYGIYAWNTTVRNFRAVLSKELSGKLAAKEKTYKIFSSYNLFKMISSTASGFEGCEANGGTHAFNVTRSASVASGGGIPSVDCFIRNCVASNCLWSGLKVQQGCYNTEVSGNTVTESAQGIITCGRNTRISGNKVSTRLPHATEFYYTHLSRGGTFGIAVIEGYACGSIVKDNSIDGFYSGLAMVDGYEDKNIFEEGNIVFGSNTVTGCVRGFTLYKNPSGAALGRNRLDVRIERNTFTAAASEGGLPDASGIHLPDQTAGLEIVSNTFRNFRQGVKTEGLVDFIGIRGNRFEECDVGVVVGKIPVKEDVRIVEAGNTYVETDEQRQGFGQEQLKEF